VGIGGGKHRPDPHQFNLKTAATSIRVETVAVGTKPDSIHSSFDGCRPY
jgi:hypothetical protein